MKLKYDKLLSNVSFNCNLRLYIQHHRVEEKHHHGRVLQVDPGLTAVDPTLAFRDFQRLKPIYYKLVANVAFNCNLRRYLSALDTIIS